MILCCGEALIDMLPRTATSGEPAFAPHPGGAVFNTAVALGRLGAPAGFLCGLSTDLFGEALAEALAASRVDAALCPRSARPTTLAFVTLVGGQARYAFYDEGTAGRMLSPADLPTVPAAVAALYFGGISLVSEPCGTAFETLCLAQAGDRPVMLDPNIRPGFVTDAAAYRARLDRMIGRTDILKLSDEDLLWLAGPGRIEDQAAAFLGRGPSVVLLTEGARGARAFHAGGVTAVPARPVTVVDTVGAGDSFNAGFLDALNRAGALTRRSLAAPDPAVIAAGMARAVAVAAITVSRAGANPPWADEIAAAGP
jgi:fructokinase